MFIAHFHHWGRKCLLVHQRVRHEIDRLEDRVSLVPSRTAAGVVAEKILHGALPVSSHVDDLDWLLSRDPEYRDRALTRAMTMLEAGTLLLFIAERAVSSSEAEIPAVDLQDLAEPEDIREQHWVEVRLVDENGEPRGSEPYRAIMADGSARTGHLDANGVARLRNIPNGGCRWCFPKLHPEEWSRGI